MPKAIIIVGPTAIGKSGLAEKIALENQLPIVSADSRQLYKELNIGVAKPESSVLALIQHVEIGSINIQDENDVAFYCKRVSEQLRTIDGDILVVGGTGFYIKALIEGLEDLPPKNDELRKRLEKGYQSAGISYLQDQYSKISQPYRLKDMNNPHRLIRAIEMGEKKENKRSKAALHNYEITMVGLQMSREKLYHSIDLRVDQMIENGLVEEARELIPYKNLQALQTVGYSELFDYFEGIYNLEFAVDKIKQHTRNYAKRQITYFSNQLDVTWFDAEETEKLNTFVSNKLS
jgi:tRNA dimethylallyltransferase